jgi:hypothetical protein
MIAGPTTEGPGQTPGETTDQVEEAVARREVSE